MKIKTNLIEVHIVKRTVKGNRYLIMKRSAGQNYPDIWQMVTGKIKEEEKAYQTAVREIKEETNLNVDKIFVVPNINYFYDNVDDSITIIPVFLVFVKNENEVKLSSEHCEYKWCDATEAKKLFAWQGQKQSLDIIEDYLTGKKKNMFFQKIDL